MPLQTNAPLVQSNGGDTRSLLGIAYMAAGLFAFSLVDTMAKFLTADFHPIQIVWSRQLGLLVGVVVLLVWKGSALLHATRPLLQILRGICAAGSATLFIFAISYVPLADALAVSFVAPFMVTLMGALILREPVGIRRWIAVIIGFLATLIIIRPGSGALHPAVFLVLVAAFLFAGRQVISRFLSGSDRTTTTVAYTAIVSVAILSLPLPAFWQWPTENWQIGLFVAMACLAAAAEVLVIRALEVAHAVIVAPIHYSMLLWGTLWGFTIFGDIPDYWTWVGALIIVATGIYMLNRERIEARQRKRQRSAVS